MIYNRKYNRWISKNGLVYRYDEHNDKLVICKPGTNGKKHFTVQTSIGKVYLHRVIWETFKGEIPKGYVIDHIDNKPENNDLSNLQCITHRLNCQLKFSRDSFVIEPRTEIGKYLKSIGITKADNPNEYCRLSRHIKMHGGL